VKLHRSFQFPFRAGFLQLEVSAVKRAVFGAYPLLCWAGSYLSLAEVACKLTFRYPGGLIFSFSTYNFLGHNIHNYRHLSVDMNVPGGNTSSVNVTHPLYGIVNVSPPHSHALPLPGEVEYFCHAPFQHKR
jgi:hypothetical protein